MSEDLVSVQILAAFGSSQDCELLRQAAGWAPVPVDVVEGDGAEAACALLASRDIDVAFLDACTPAADLAACLTAARSARRQPFVILVASSAAEFKAAGAAADGIVAKPARIEQAQVLVQRCIQLRLPSRVLVVDDSLTMRAIVCKLLQGTRFPLQITEAQDGIGALKAIASNKYDFVFLDYNMPGLNGIETLSEIKRQYPRIQVVIMTSAQDEAVADRARSTGAAAFLKKPFYPADIEAVLHAIYGLRDSDAS